MGQMSFASLVILVLLSTRSLLIVDGKNDGSQSQSDSSFTPINRKLYRTSGKLMEEIGALVNRHHDELSMETFRSQNKGYKAELTVVTYTQKRKSTDEKSKFRILLSFGQHARELITSELAFKMLSILTGEKLLPKMKPMNRTLEKLIIKVVPVENLNGRKLVEAGELCERRNGRRVDLNRNWSVDWGKKEKDYDPYEENPGTGPFSEPETQLMRKLSESFKPHIWVNVHSGMEALFMPYDHKNTTPDGLPSRKMKLILETLNHRHFRDRCVIGSGGGSVGYLAHGTATDYMFDIAKVPMAFTFEIYGDEKVSPKDCFKMFNPVDSTTFNRVLNEWSAAILTMLDMGPRIYSETTNPSNRNKFVSMEGESNEELMEKNNRNGEKMEEMFDLGLHEIRTYFRLFLISSVLLMFMFCSRISKTTGRSIVSTASC